MKVKLALAMAASALVGCAAAPTPASQPSTFSLAVAGDVAPKSYQAVADCIMDGLDASSPMLANTTVRQQVRSAGYRIDRFAGAIILLTIDIRQDGRVELRESTSAALVSTREDHAVVSSCIDKFKAT